MGLETHELAGIVREQFDLPDAEVHEDLRSDAVVAQIRGIPQTDVRLDGVESLILQRVRLELGREPDAATFLAKIQQHPAPAPMDRPQRRVELGATVAALRAEHVARQTLRMNARQHRTAARDLALDQSHVMVALEPALVEMELESPLGRRQRDGHQTPHEQFLLATMGDEVLDREDPQVVLLAEALEIGQAGHAPILAQDLAYRGDRLKAGQRAQIGSGLGVAGAAQHAARHRAQREHVAGAVQVLRARARVRERAQRAGAVEHRGAGRGAAPRVDRFRERRAELGRVLRHHQLELEPVRDLGIHGRAQDAAAVLDGEVHHLGRRALGGEHDIALVLAIGVVDDDDHLVRGDAPHRLFDGQEHRGAVRGARGGGTTVPRDLDRARAARRADPGAAHDWLLSSLPLWTSRER